MNDETDLDGFEDGPLEEEDLEPVNLGAVTEETHGSFLGSIFDGTGGRFRG